MNIKKIFWAGCGFVLLGIAYLGVILPGLPWSIFVVMAAYCFAKSSERMHNWLYSHKLFGPFLTNWSEKKVFPLKLKYFMIATMTTTVAFTYFATGNTKAALWTGGFMILVSVYCWRYPSTVAEYDRRKSAGEKIAWFK
jgi:uncharacterized membrane protein YbaN (DUF454 family)